MIHHPKNSKTEPPSERQQCKEFVSCSCCECGPASEPEPAPRAAVTRSGRSGGTLQSLGFGVFLVFPPRRNPQKQKATRGQASLVESTGEFCPQKQSPNRFHNARVLSGIRIHRSERHFFQTRCGPSSGSRPASLRVSTSSLRWAPRK